MAATGNSEESLRLAVDMLTLQDNFDPSLSRVSFKIVGGGLDTVVRAKTSREAVLKATFVFYRLGMAVEKFHCEHEECLYEYKVVHSSGSPRVLLQWMSRKPEPSPNDSMTIPANETTENPNDEYEESTTDLLQTALLKVFGFREFRPRQREIITASMLGETVLAILGTGGGKSLTFMLPAALSRKTTIVVSPTRSLIEDFMDRSQNCGLYSCKFLGGMAQEVLCLQAANVSQYRIVYTTPEALEEHLMDTIISLEDGNNIERIVFDEAHAICTWGSTFRPKYKEVSERLSKLKCPKLLLSATVPGRIQKELKSIFGKDSWQVITQSVHRDNLTLKVKDRESKYLDDLESYIKEREHDCGIVYCVLPKDVSSIHGELLKRGVNCVKYHGQLSETVKQSSFQKWMTGESNLIIANASFGMGMDKPNVRFVIHVRLPTSIEDYYQQCGRAGRDGLPADCILYFNYNDKCTLYKLFNKENKLTEQHTILNELVVFLENVVDCRHKLIMQYFGETREEFSCLSKCDNCKSRGTYFITDGTRDALKIIQTVIELGEVKCTSSVLKLILIGSKQKKIQEQEFDQLANYGCLAKKITSTMLDKFLHILIEKQVLTETINASSHIFSIKVSLGPKAHDVIALRYGISKFVRSR